MQLEWDEQKRALTLEKRNLDFADAAKVFAKLNHERIAQGDHGELRLETIGRLNGKTVMVVWTKRGPVRRIISMRICSVKERKLYQNTALDRSG